VEREEGKDESPNPQSTILPKTNRQLSELNNSNPSGWQLLLHHHHQ
jgi:hypothetical protein